MDPPPELGASGAGTCGSPCRRGFCWLKKIVGQVTGDSEFGVIASGGWREVIELNAADVLASATWQPLLLG